MNRLFFILSICGLIACISINFLVVSGIFLPDGMWFVAPLAIGMFAVLIPATFKLKKQNETPQGIKGARKRQKTTKTLMLSFWYSIPKGMKIIIVLTILYGIANFITMMFLLGNEQATFENGRYIMESKGTFLREITQAEYHQNKAYQASLFTGHIAVFYSLAMMLHYPMKK